MSKLWTPLWGVVFALGGAGLAWLWYHTLFIWPLLVVGIVFGVGAAMEAHGRRLVRTSPVQSIWWFERRSFSIGALTAAGAAVAIILGVHIAVDGAAATDTGAVRGEKEALKAVVGSVAASLVAFVTALTMKAEDVDEAIGDRVREAFQRTYVGPPAIQRGTPDAPPAPFANHVVLPPGDGLDAVYDLFDPPDWSKSNRRLRARRLQDYLNENPEQVARSG